MVERVVNQSLGSYMEKKIWEPLGMTLTGFRLQERPDIKARRADMSKRADDSTIVPSPTRWFSDDMPDDHGGGGIFSCSADYIKILIALLKNDGTLLKPTTMDLLFEPCLGSDSATAFQNIWPARYKEDKTDPTNIRVVEMSRKANWALGGMLVQEDMKGARKAGSMSWGGLPNLSWVLDRHSGLALFYASQLLPPGDKMTRSIFYKFENAVYSGELGKC
jgi:CubicO group peptidase (beta-lactamase class C family)